MITLYTFGSAFGLPDPSPFVVKAEMLLEMAGLPYRTDTGGLRRAPKGKLPYIDDDGTLVADSTFIRWHLEQRHGVDFDAGLDETARGIAWSVEKMLEEHLYWAIVHSRWMDDHNFSRGPAAFFRTVPAPLRPLVMAFVRRQIRKSLRGQGFGRHTNAEIEQLGARSIAATAAVLGARPWLMGEQPCGADATVFAFIGSVLCPAFETPLRIAAESHQNLVAYVDRVGALHYPKLYGDTRARV